MDRQELKQKAIDLRLQGYLYSEICEVLQVNIPKGTLSGWFSGTTLSDEAQSILRQKYSHSSLTGQQAAVAANRKKRLAQLDALASANAFYSEVIKSPIIAKCALAMLYLGEGSKTDNGAIQLGNSNPDIIKLYLRLLRQIYDIKAEKLRGRIQCRADQDILALEQYWQSITNIPAAQFYPTYVDRRTIGKPSRKSNYKGVLVVTYLSSHVFQDIMATIKVIMGH